MIVSFHIIGHFNNSHGMCGESASQEKDSAPQEQLQETKKLCLVSPSKHSIHESTTPEKETQGKIIWHHLLYCTTHLFFCILCNYIIFNKITHQFFQCFDIENYKFKNKHVDNKFKGLKKVFLVQ